MIAPSGATTLTITRAVARTVTCTVALAIALTVATAGCGATPPDHLAAIAKTATPTPTSTPGPTASVVARKPLGPPPRKGTLAWYVYQVPQFAAPPVPVGVTKLAATGPAQLFVHIPVRQKVAFLTIDDGWVHTTDAFALLRAAHIPFTMFLTTNAVRTDPFYFTTLEGFGGVIEDHTITHSDLASMSYAGQRHEICDSAAALGRWYGRFPVLMRAPYGESNADTLKAAASCHIRAAVFWNEMVVDGKVQYQRPGGIHPGDMILMHFKDTFREDFLAAVTAMHRSGVTPALLENYLVAPPTPMAEAGTPAPLMP